MADKVEAVEQTGNDRRALGLVLMASAMLLIPMRDGIAKHLSGEISVFVVAWGTYASAALFALPTAWLKHGQAAVLPAGLGSQTARTLLLVISMTLFFFSIRSVPLANAISVFFVAPFVAAVLAPIVLKENTSWQIQASVALGFVGVLIVIRPDTDFDANILWALASGVLFAFYMLATRLAARQAPPLAALSFQCVLGALVLTPFALSAGLPNFQDVFPIFILAGIFQCLSHGLSISAFRFAPAGILAPLVYLEIVGAVIVGLVAFGDWPTPYAWLGIFIIMAAGGIVSVTKR